MFVCTQVGVHPCVCASKHVCHGMNALTMNEPQDNFVETVLSFYLCVDSGSRS